jgi:hypothetical protein
MSEVSSCITSISFKPPGAEGEISVEIRSFGYELSQPAILLMKIKDQLLKNLRYVSLQLKLAPKGAVLHDKMHNRIHTFGFIVEIFSGTGTEWLGPPIP